MATYSTNTIDLEDWDSLPDSYFFTVQEVADILRHRTRKSVDTAIKNGTLRAINVGGQQRAQYRIQKTALKEFIETKTVKPPLPSRPATSRSPNGRPFKHLKATWLEERASADSDEPKRPSRKKSGTSRGGPRREN